MSTSPRVAERTVKRLFALSRNRCAAPGCVSKIVETSGSVVGKICHIKGARAGSARYDKNQSDEERHGFENLILLCGLHHDVIDKEEKAHSVETLCTWKRAQERPENNELSLADAKLARRLYEDYLSNVAIEIFTVTQKVNGDGNYVAGRDQHFHYGKKDKPKGRAKPPADVVTEDQAVRLRTLIHEVIELDSASDEGRSLTEGELRKKWWGALERKVPKTTYTNYSQAKYKRAMEWLKAQRARLVSGAAAEQPELAPTAAVRAIHSYVSRNKLDKIVCYNDWSARLNIVPAFTSTKNLTDKDLQRVYQAVLRDTKGKTESSRLRS
jgi:hypothetical protein